MIHRELNPSALGSGHFPSGYSHPGYVQSLREFGRPRELQACGGWLLERTIPGTHDTDAMGSYPLFTCRDWERLKGDLDDLAGELVTVGLVADPFANVTPAELRKCFDVVVPFKDRFVVDLAVPVEQIGSKHHRANARKALAAVEVEVCSNPEDYLDEWTELYDTVIRKFGLTGIRAFSRRAFVMQFSIPGLVMFRASHEGRTIGLDWWFVDGDVAYGHLAAYNETGYKLRASYGVKWNIIRHFIGKVRWIDLGGAAGATQGKPSGLAEFKQGWSTEKRATYFCGRVLDQKRYAELAAPQIDEGSTYFPLYRLDEF
jgi:hypothetical protein